jgi:hypothetical protein
MHWVGVVSDRPISRRVFGITVLGGLLANCGKRETATTESPTVAKARLYAEQHLPPERREWLIKTAAEVERDYTTAPVRVQIRDRVYEVPDNYYTMVGRARFKRFLVPGADRYEIPEPSQGLGQLHFFWPDFGGFTLDNWYEPFDKRMITYAVFAVLAPDAMMKTTAEVLEHLKQFGLIEREPSAELHGLRGYRRSNQRQFVWVGERATGEVFAMSSFHPGEPDAFAALPNPQCDVRLYEAATREDVVYRYSLDLFAHWREIDTRTRATISAWRVK